MLFNRVDIITMSGSWNCDSLQTCCILSFWNILCYRLSLQCSKTTKEHCLLSNYPNCNYESYPGEIPKKLFAASLFGILRASAEQCPRRCLHRLLDEAFAVSLRCAQFITNPHLYLLWKSQDSMLWQPTSASWESFSFTITSIILKTSWVSNDTTP